VYVEDRTQNCDPEDYPAHRFSCRIVFICANSIAGKYSQGVG